MKQIITKILSKNKFLDKVARKIWHLFKMHIFEVVHIHTYNTTLDCKRIYLFGKVINCPKAKADNETHVFYFKINRDVDYAFMCIQHWMNSLNVLGDDYLLYFVCDNKFLERKIVRLICFRDNNIYFIPSMNENIKAVAENLYTKYWKNATYAHLTPFYHAKQFGYKKYWAIDGDDTMFCTDIENVAAIIKKVEKLAISENYTAISLDMWRSRTHGKHWSLGVVFINDTNNLCGYFEGIHDKKWMEYYKEWDIAFNVDWFFNYLKDYKDVKVETFYVENCYFIHWGDFFRNPIGSSICYWHDGDIVFPLLTGVYKNDELGKLSIAKDAIKIDFGEKLDNGLKFLENEITILRLYGPELTKLNYLEDFGKHTKYFY